MCRNKDVGGRRCPSHTDPSKIAAYNSHRREIYAARKNKKAVQVQQESKTPLFAQYGFAGPDSARVETSNLKEQATASEIEMAALTKAQRNALSVFSGDNYKWVNGMLFGNSTLRPPAFIDAYGEKAGLPKPLSKMSIGESRILIEGTADSANEIINTMDSVFASSPNEKKIVYRGQHHKASYLDNGVDEYVDNNYSVGKEFVFEGYQSTTSSPTTAYNYAVAGGAHPDGESSGIVFEMKTHNGAKIQNISHYEDEQEILLPRQTRWKVVGVHKKIVYRQKDNLQDESNLRTKRKVTVVQLVEINDDGSELVVKRKLDKMTVEHCEQFVI